MRVRIMHSSVALTQLLSTRRETTTLESMGCTAADAMRLLSQLQRKVQMSIEVEKRLEAEAIRQAEDGEACWDDDWEEEAEEEEEEEH